ncbi:MAG: hypothetical protein DMF72_13265 [Acidobacteria bacterium]|nr:MAG: hypothetical protein DMF72_13265 [Acidobacteriota bacterium]
MSEVAVRQPKTKFTEVFLRMLSTDIPSRALPRNLILSSSARLSVVDEGLIIEVIALDPEINYYNGEPDFEDQDPPVIQIALSRTRLLKLVIGGTTHSGKPTAILYVSDPGEIVESFHLTFASEEPNNPTYPIKVFARMLAEHFGMTIKDVNLETKWRSSRVNSSKPRL